MDVRAAFVADVEAPEAVQPGERALDHPAQLSEAAAMRAPRPGDDGGDALAAEAGVAWGRPVGAVALHHARLSARPPGTPADGRQRGDQRLELRHVVDVGRGEVGDQRDAARVRDDVVLRALLTAIGWVRSSFFPRGARAGTRCQSPSSRGRVGRGGAVRPAGLRGAAATPPRAATAPSAASTYCPSRTPSRAAAFATARQSATRTKCPSTLRDPGPGPGHADARVASAAAGSTGPGAPTSHHPEGVEPCPTVPSRAVEYKGMFTSFETRS